jgi:hypothetical protein
MFVVSLLTASFSISLNTTKVKQQFPVDEDLILLCTFNELKTLFVRLKEGKISSIP